jgi:hypothetical protein
MLSVEPLLKDPGTLDLSDIGWVILGGESGPKARPMQADWVRSVRDQSQAVGVPFFFKQWGGTRKHGSGRELDGRTHDQVPARREGESGPVFQLGAGQNAIRKVEPLFLCHPCPPSLHRQSDAIAYT